MIFAMIFRGIFRKFPENINKTLIAARELSVKDSCNVLCLFGFGEMDKKMFYTICKYSNYPSKSQKHLAVVVIGFPVRTFGGGSFSFIFHKFPQNLNKTLMENRHNTAIYTNMLITENFISLNN